MIKQICTVALIGRPNVGKSTILNNILDFNLAIVTNQAQTTRDQIRGIYNDEKYQIIFVDTPGIHKAEYLISEKLNEKSYSALQEVDLVLFVCPADQEIGKGDQYIIKRINDLNIQNKIAVISKIDLIDDRSELNKKAKKLKEIGFKRILGVGNNLKQTYSDLIEEIKPFCYESEALYEEDQYGDITLRFMAKEIIREAAIENLYEEIPHSIAVEINEFIEPDEDAFPYKIDATIYVKKESQKAIVIGKSGNMIKKISVLSRQKMINTFQHKVNLVIKVKVDDNWVNNEQKIKKLGY